MTKRNILITGGAGFIGSHVARLFAAKYADYRIVILDKLTYAGNLDNIADVCALPNVAFVEGDMNVYVYNDIVNEDADVEESVCVDENGNPIATEDLVKYVVKDENGKPLKEWDAIADYLCSMEGEMDSRYSKTDGRKVVYSSLKPADLLRNANAFTYGVIIFIAVLVATAVIVVRLIVVRRRKKKALQN